jgi:CRP/FNR family transcriptional regulator
MSPASQNAVSAATMAAVCTRCGIHRLCHPTGYGADTVARLVRRKRSLRPGEYLFRAGEPFHSIYGVCSGTVKSYAFDRDGAVQITGFHLPGELVGLNALASRQYVSNAVALDATSVCELLCHPLEAMREQDPALGRDIYDLLGLEILDTYRQLSVVLGKKNAAEKLSAFIYSLCRRHRERGLPDTDLRLSMSRSDIADYLGLTKETVCRLFTRLEADGLLRVRGKRLRIEDLAALRRHAGVDAESLA